MRKLTRGAAARIARKILHINDTPERTAAAFALGVSIGFSPFLMCHWILALLLAFTLRLNRLAVFTGTFANNPYTFVPILAGGTQLGSFILGRGWILQAVPRPGDFHSFSALGEYVLGLKPLWLPFFIGNTILSLAVYAPAYFVALSIVRKIRHRHEARLALAAEVVQAGDSS